MESQNRFTSKLTSKCQATIPLGIRRMLGVKKGEIIEFSIDGNTVLLKKPTPVDFEYLKSISSSLSEWNSKNDDEAYENL